MPRVIVKIIRDSSVPGTTGEAITTGEVCSISSSDGLIYLACAGAGIEELPMVGVAETTQAAGEEIELKRLCQVEGEAALNPGGPVYISNTPGAVQAAAGDILCLAGIGLSATKYHTDPEIIAQQTQH